MKSHVVDKWLSSVLHSGEVVISEIEVSVATRALGQDAAYSARMMLTESRILVFGKSWIGEFSQIIHRSTVTSVVAKTQFLQGVPFAKGTLVTVSHAGTESHFPTISKNFMEFVEIANSPSASNAAKTDGQKNLASDLAQLSELYEKGLLSAEEFEQSKKRLLN